MASPPTLSVSGPARPLPMPMPVSSPLAATPLGKDEIEGPHSALELMPVLGPVPTIVLAPLLVLPLLAVAPLSSAQLVPPIEIIDISYDEEIDWDLLETEIDEEEVEEKGEGRGEREGGGQGGI